MRKHLMRIAAAFLGFAALALTVKAQVPDQAIINIPYQFVVADTALPAGTYRLTRASSVNNRELLLSNQENRTAVFILPITVDDVPADKATFTFAEIAGQHFLTKIETASHVFVLPASKAAILTADKTHQGSAPAGVSGTD